MGPEIIFLNHISPLTISVTFGHYLPSETFLICCVGTVRNTHEISETVVTSIYYTFALGQELCGGITFNPCNSIRQRETVLILFFG